jgi:hypothetical protein
VVKGKGERGNRGSERERESSGERGEKKRKSEIRAMEALVESCLQYQLFTLKLLGINK